MNILFHHPLPFSFHPKKKVITAVIPSHYSVGESRLELKKMLGINMEIGIFISALIHVLIIGSYYAVQYYDTLDEDAPVVKIRILRYSDLGPPPSIANSIVTPSVGVMKEVRPTIGTPVPVPDAEINPELTIATQTEMSSVPSSALLEGEGSGTEVKIEENVTIENDEPGMNEFMPVEKIPQVVYSEKPEYPDIARRSSMEGYVWVKILVDKTGKPKKAVVIKENGGSIFNEAAVNAAMRYQFTPGVMNSGPVQVWVAIKFNFQLTDRK